MLLLNLYIAPLWLDKNIISIEPCLHLISIHKYQTAFRPQYKPKPSPKSKQTRRHQPPRSHHSTKSSKHDPRETLPLHNKHPLPASRRLRRRRPGFRRLPELRLPALRRAPGPRPFLLLHVDLSEQKAESQGRTLARTAQESDLLGQGEQRGRECEGGEAVEGAVGTRGGEGELLEQGGESYQWECEWK